MNLVKDPDATLDYTIDWSAWLPDTDSIIESEWIVPDDLTASDESLAGAAATVWLAGGVLGETYRVTNRITTLAGRIDDRTLRLLISSR